ncbi:phage holin, LLH family [Limosilactobacillus reuteri]|uniref:phage holin, LLH family n=1 Tax=Limosilactobacillus reuteri TaxID=1598 RepID=UPI001EF468E8|nr:phage holin, LLH family [Limosilactobacillus reuteri]
MMKTINEIWNYLLSTGTFGVIVVFAWMYVRPVLEQKKLHAKTLQEKEMLDVTEKLADQAVTSLASNNDITGHEKFKIATGLVANTLADKGFKVDDKVVDHVVQSAYEKSDLTPTVNPDAKPQTGVVVHND